MCRQLRQHQLVPPPGKMQRGHSVPRGPRAHKPALRTIGTPSRCDVFQAQHGAEATHFADAVQRCKAYLAAGADCVYFFGLRNPQAIAEFVKAVPGPVKCHRPARNAHRTRATTCRCCTNHDRFGTDSRHNVCHSESGDPTAPDGRV
jgi:2-methylisocitrate lyase-like PEP mutase family enzyme